MLVLQYPRLHAAVFPVSLNDDAGEAGTLRQEIIDSNTAGGSNTISWSSGGGTISILSDLAGINANTTLDVTAAVSTVAIAGAFNMPLQGAVTFRNDNQAINWAVSSIIAGPGSLNKTGSGYLTLTGINTYTGGTSISGGILSINGDAALGAASGGLTFDGGALRALAPLTSARPITLNAGGGVVDTFFYNVVLTGAIGGVGGLTKQGVGTLDLAGAGAYAGGTTIGAGTLRVDADGVLPAGGALTVSSGATLDLGGTQQAVQSYADGGTMKVRIQPGLTNLAVTNGTVLSGPLQVGLAPQVVTAGQVFQPITDGAGALTGTFSSILSPAAVAFDPTYQPGGVLLTARLIPFADVAATRNQRAVGNALEPLRAAPSGDMATVIGNLYTLGAQQLQQALDQIGPLSLASMRGLGVLESDAQSRAIDRRLAAAADGTAAPASGDWAAGRIAGPDSPWAFFVSGVGGDALLQKFTDASQVSLNTGGFLTGVDYGGEHFTAGFSGAYLSGRSTVNYSTGTNAMSTGLGAVDKKSVRYGVYAEGHGGGFHGGVYAGKSQDRFSTSRNIDFGNIVRTAGAKPRGAEWNAHTNAAYDLWAETWGTVAPTVDLNYDKFRVGSFTENGADSLDLEMPAQQDASFRSGLGVRYTGSVDLAPFKLTARFNAGWRHEFTAQKAVTAQLASGMGGAFSVNPLDFGQDGLLTGIGFSVDWGRRATLRLDYTGDYSSRVTEQVFSGGVQLKF